MGKAIFGILVLIAFLWFLRRAWVFFVGQRGMTNARTRLERAQNRNTIRDIEKKAEAIESEFEDQPKS